MNACNINVNICHLGYSRAFYEIFEGAIHLHQVRISLHSYIDTFVHKSNKDTCICIINLGKRIFGYKA